MLMEKGADKFTCCSTDVRIIGRVTPGERDEIRALYERKNGLSELFRSLVNISKEDLENSNLYERIIKDMGDVTTKFQHWWNEKSSSYNWERMQGYRWEINFETCEILLVKN